jgi:hypothetical protein
MDAAGNLYGTTQSGVGSFGPPMGTVFELAKTSSTAGTVTTIKSASSPSVFGQSVTFTATVAPVGTGLPTPTGTVTFMDGSTMLGTRTLNSAAKATFSTSTLAVTSHSITAVYSGDANFTTSTSSAVAQVVNQDGSVTVVASSLNPSVYGKSVTFTATLTAAAPGSGTPTGTVEFMDGSTTLRTATLTGGKATFQTSTLSTGSQLITAVYGGDGNFTTSTSKVLSQTVQPANVTSDLSVKLGGFAYNRTTRKFTQTVTITNISGAAITGPIELVLLNLENATLVNETSVTQASAYITVVSSGSLGIGQSVTIALVFADPTLATITDTPEFLAGPIPSDD